jgi:hypothetical protein
MDAMMQTLIDQVDWVRGLLIGLVFLQLAFMFIYFRSMNNMVDGFNQVIRGLQAVTEELERHRRDRT